MNILVCGRYDAGRTELCRTYYHVNFDQAETKHEVTQQGNKTIYTIEYLGHEVNFIDFEMPQECLDFLQEPDMDIDAVMMLISVTDGPMPPTCELITACLEAGITNIVPLLTKCDLEYDDELLEIAGMEGEEVFAEAGYFDMMDELPEFYKTSVRMAQFDSDNEWWHTMEAALVTAMHNAL